MIDPDLLRHVAQLPLLAPTLLVPRDASVRLRTDDGKPPVVFVHGLGGSRGDFLYLSSYLGLRGRKRRYAPNIPARASMSQRATVLADYIREVVRLTGAPQIDLVGHSLGGVTARVAVDEHDLGTLVRTLVTLGTPHAGTYTARFAGSELTRALRPEGPLFKRLRPAPPSVRCVSLWSRSDLLVVPAESAAMEGAEHVEMTPFTHYSYLLDSRSWRTVARILDGHPPHD